MFPRIRGSMLTAGFSVIGTTLAVQLGYLGPNNNFVSNLLTVTVVWVLARALSWILGK